MRIAAFIKDLRIRIRINIIYMGEKNMPPVKGKAVKFVNFESPLVGFHLNTWEFNKALESYNNIMLNFHGNIRGNGAAIKEISNLYSNKIGRKSYIDIDDSLFPLQ